jgi:hypothetical protein
MISNDLSSFVAAMQSQELQDCGPAISKRYSSSGMVLAFYRIFANNNFLKAKKKESTCEANNSRINGKLGVETERDSEKKKEISRPKQGKALTMPGLK